MRKWILGGMFAAMLAVPQPALALKIAMPNYTTAQKATLADTVVTGKVTSIEADTVELELYPGSKEKAAFKVAIIKIDTALSGAKNITHLKVVFSPMPLNNSDQKPGVRPFRPAAGPVAVTEGQEGIFFLVPNAPGSALLKIPMGLDPIAANAANYKDELAKVTRTGEIIANPLKALKAKDLADRQAAVAVLGQKYRGGSPSGGPMEQVAIPAEESKLILATILETDWTLANNDHQSTGAGMASLFGLSPGQHGIPRVVPKPGEDFNVKWKETLMAWAKTNGDTLELKKFVPKK